MRLKKIFLFNLNMERFILTFLLNAKPHGIEVNPFFTGNSTYRFDWVDDVH
jgi:hypothetical protein